MRRRSFLGRSIEVWDLMAVVPESFFQDGLDGATFSVCCDV